MYSYGSVLEAIDHLRERGYTEDFNLEENCISAGNSKYGPDEFEITEVYRFEGDSDPDEESVVYGISSSSGVKGLLVDGYGVSAAACSADIARKLRMHAQ